MKKKYKSVTQITITLNNDVYMSALAWAGRKEQKISAYIEWALKMQETYNRKHYKAGEIWVSDLGRWMTKDEYAAYIVHVVVGEDKLPL